MSFQKKQQGYSLFLVLILMLVIALIVIVTVQATSTESRISTDEADRKFALSKAEGGLREAENLLKEYVYKYTNSTTWSTNPNSKPNLYEFDWACTDGLCKPQAGTFTPVQNTAPFRFKNEGGANQNANDFPSWERCANGTNAQNACSGADNILESGGILAKDGTTRYIIEYLGHQEITVAGDDSTHDYFRVTSRAHGNSKDTVVTLQSHIDLERYK